MEDYLDFDFFGDKYLPEENSEMLYHYASIETADSILFNSENKIKFWVSNVESMIDQSEGKIAEKIYRECCEALFKEGKLSVEEYNLIKDVQTSKTMYVIRKSDKKNIDYECKENFVDSYICCFSRDSDSLKLWNEYIKDNGKKGYCMGFDTSEIKAELQKYFGSGIEYSVCKVIYDYEEQKKYIEKYIIELIGYARKIGYKNTVMILAMISQKLFMWKLLYKKKVYEHEMESRIIVHIPKNEKCDFEIKHRGDDISYIELEFEMAALNEVMLSPKCSCNDEKNNLEKKLLKNGYLADNVWIEFSKHK